ncbi:MAG TPA: serine/threonine-protein kinase [Polyangia bacterium]
MSTIRICSHCGGSFAGTLAVCPEDRTPLFAPEVVARIGMRLKDHEILGVIGEGGMGVVYRAQHVVLERPVAIKVLHDRFAKETESVEQFLLEAKAASRIRHPNIINVTDIGTTDEGLVFMVMEYLEGENLEERLHRVGRLAVFDAVNILGQVARGLGAAHELGIIHRDLKPANIFLVSREGRRRVVRRLSDPSDNADIRFKVEPEGNYDVAKLLDFGVAKFVDLGPSAATRAGVVCGTPYYVSPEQAQELPLDTRSDIYSLGAVFYEMITGAVPFSGSSLLEILTGHVTGTVIPPSERAPNARIDAHTDAVVLKCLAKNPEERFTTTEDFCDALRDCVGDRAFFRDVERLPGIQESAFDLSPAKSKLLDVEELSETSRFRPIRTQGTSPSLVGAALVILVGAGLALWLLGTKSTSEASSKVPIPASAHVAAPPSIAPPIVLVKVSPSPAIETSTSPSAVSTTHLLPPSNENNVLAGAHLEPERSVRRMPLPPPLSQPVPATVVPKLAPAVAVAAVAPFPVALPTVDSQALVHEAQQAWVRKHYALAVDRAQLALAQSPDLQLAHQIVTLCSCALHRAEDAKQAAGHLDPAKRSLVRTLCEKDGVTLDPD